MRAALFLAAFLFVPAAGLSATTSATNYVPDDYPTIQDAIDGSIDGDIVIVRPGTYVENIDFLGKAVTVESERGPDVTIIDGNRVKSVVTFSSGEDAGSVLDGFQVTNGAGNADPWGFGWPCGGGIYCHQSSPTITNCIVTDNHSIEIGGGMFSEVGSPTVTDCTFSLNSAVAAGGDGGGMFLSGGSPTVTGCSFTQNKAKNNGGGMYVYMYCDLTLTDCTFIQNTGPNGGGIYSYIYCDPVISNCVFAGNTASSGGGMWNWFHCSPTVTNCTFYGNTADAGGGMWNWVSSDPVVTNCIFWNDSPDEIRNDSSSPVVTYCCVQDGYPGEGNIETDPLMTGPVYGDYHLTSESPCKNAGDSSVVAGPFDFEGDPRVADGEVDMGADEFHTHLYHLGDVVPGSAISIRIVGKPSDPVLLGLGSGIKDPPRPTIYGPLFLELPLVGHFILPSIPSDGVLIFPTKVPAAWLPGDQYPLQALVGPLGNPESALTNLMLLDVE
jgi:predicted outer membrane repeat protein